MCQVFDGFKRSLNLQRVLDDFFLMDSYSFHLLLKNFYLIFDQKFLFIYMLLHINQHFQFLDVGVFNFEIHYLHTKILKFFSPAATMIMIIEMFKYIFIIYFFVMTCWMIHFV